MATTKERILAAIDILDDAQLEAVYATIQQFTGEAREDPETPGGTLADDFRVLRRLLAEEGIEWQSVPRNDDRANAFLADLDGDDDGATD